MQKLFIGIDVGVSGAIAVIGEDGPIEVMDMPVTIGTDNKLKVCPVLLGTYLEQWSAFNLVECVVIEHVASMPKQGITSAFNFGVSFGVCQGVVGSLKLPVRMVRPHVWKSHFGLKGKDKDYARTQAIQTWPKMADDLKRKKDCDRADALWLAKYAEKLAKD